MDNEDSLLEEIQTLEAQVAEKQKALAHLLTLTPEQRFITWLHKRFCTFNHTDGCAWYYEQAWDEAEHREWTNRAQQIVVKIKELRLL